MRGQIIWKHVVIFFFFFLQFIKRNKKTLNFLPYKMYETKNNSYKMYYSNASRYSMKYKQIINDCCTFYNYEIL